MKFRSTIDRFYLIFHGIALLIVAVACFFPYFIEEKVPVLASFILIGTFVLCTGFLLWMLFDIRYEIKPDHLFVKAGPVRKKISYVEISRVSPTRDVFSGFHLLSSRDAIEIFYRSALMGSIKISPFEKELFLKELRNHVPDTTSQELPF